MKVLLFTRKQDIDGIGNIVLAKKAFTDLEYITCSTFEITERVKEKISDKSIYEYDKIFVTDLCIKEPVLTRIEDDEILKEKILVLDHHISEIVEGNDKYNFVNIELERKGKKECATSLFYQYLIGNNYIEETKELEKLVENTRQYDTWDWEKKNNLDSRNLHVIFEAKGTEYYLEMASYLLENNCKFREMDLEVIKKFEKKLSEDIEKIVKNMIVLPDVLKGYKVGFVDALYKYKNEIPEYIKHHNKEKIDVIGMIMQDNNTVAYRGITNLEVYKIPVLFGGKGNKSAGTNFKTNPKFREHVLDRIKYIKLQNARDFCTEVRKISEKYNLPFFVVTEGASDTCNFDSDAVKNAIDCHEKWKIEHGCAAKSDYLEN